MNKKLCPRRLIQISALYHQTPEEMAAACGVSVSTYYRYKAGEISPDYDVLKRLIDRFKIDASWLFNDQIV